MHVRVNGGAPNTISINRTRKKYERFAVSYFILVNTLRDLRDVGMWLVLGHMLCPKPGLGHARCSH